MAMTIADYEFIQQDSSTIYILYIDHDKKNDQKVSSRYESIKAKGIKISG